MGCTWLDDHWSPHKCITNGTPQLLGWRCFDTAYTTLLEAEAGWMSNVRYVRTHKGKMNYTKNTKEDFHEDCELGWSSFGYAFLKKMTNYIILNRFQDLPSIEVWFTYFRAEHSWMTGQSPCPSCQCSFYYKHFHLLSVRGVQHVITNLVWNLLTPFN